MQNQNTIPFVLTAKQLQNFNAKLKTSTTYSYNGSPCREWIAGRDKFGYGLFKLNGKTQVAHRIAWVIAHGAPEPDKPCVLHRCDHPPCCEELHLFTGTKGDNNRDRKAKGRSACGDLHYSRRHPERLARGNQHPARLHPERMARGERNGRARLLDAELPEVFRLRSHGMTQLEIGIAMDMSGAQISNILRGKQRVVML